MNPETILGVIRHILTFLGGFAIAKGYISADTLPGLVGAVITIVGVVWSAIDKKVVIAKVEGLKAEAANPR